jgi:hypothetical protein
MNKIIETLLIILLIFGILSLFFVAVSFVNLNSEQIRMYSYDNEEIPLKIGFKSPVFCPNNHSSENIHYLHSITEKIADERIDMRLRTTNVYYCDICKMQYSLIPDN